MSKVSRGGRFAADTVGTPGLMTGKEVGPGSYTSRAWGNSIADDEVKRGSLTSRLLMNATPMLKGLVLGFGSRYKANELPHEVVGPVKEATPGPGSYDPQVDELGRENEMAVRKGAETMQNSVFVSKTKRTGYPIPDHMGDPGSYDPAANRAIAHDVKAEKSFNSVVQSGKGGFLAQSVRELVIPADLNGEAQPTRNDGIKETANSVHTGLQQTPGPAAYEPKTTEIGKEFDMSVRDGAETMPNAVFKSTTARAVGLVHASEADVPGPGTYNPSDKQTINHLPGANPEANLMSKVSRGGRYTADTVGTPGLMTGEEVGPGSYDPMRDIDGELNTLAQRVEDRATGNMDASFTSTKDRDIFAYLVDEWRTLTA